MGEGLDAGRLKAVVVCTSSLDLGVDFRPVESVVQIGHPRKAWPDSPARRARRSRPDASSAPSRSIPYARAGIGGSAALRVAVEDIPAKWKRGRIRWSAVSMCWPVLVTLAVGNEFDPCLLDEVRTRPPYSARSAKRSGHGSSPHHHRSGGLKAYDEFRKCTSEHRRLVRVEDRRVAASPAGHRHHREQVVSSP